jgi:hypothetical protein
LMINWWMVDSWLTTTWMQHWRLRHVSSSLVWVIHDFMVKKQNNSSAVF